MSVSASSRDDARNLLLASLNPNSNGFASCSDTDWEHLPWDWLLERARVHKIAALFAGRMDQHGFIEDVPDRIREGLKKIQGEAAARTARAARTLRMIHELYGERSIPFLLVKGGVLSEQVYGDPHLRPFYDVDVLIPDEHMTQAERILLDRGYFFLRPQFLVKHLNGSDEDLESGLRRLLHERHRNLSLVLREDDPRLPVELHWHITKPGILKVDAAGLWSQATHTNVSGLSVRTLSLEGMLLHTAVHAMEQPPRKFKLLHLCDVVWIIERLGHKLRVPVLREMIRAWGAERHLFGALKAAETIFPFPVPEANRYTRPSRWSRCCLHLAGVKPSIVDHKQPRWSLGRVVLRLLREIFWDLSFLRPPIRARETLSDSFAAFTARMRGSKAQDQPVMDRDD
jgi:hypothetical protein